MKRLAQVGKLMDLYQAVGKDIRAWNPHIYDVRDDIEMTLRFNTRGLGFVTHDLPRLSKALLGGLESGCLGPIPGFKRKKGSAVPELYQGLWCLVFCRISGRLLEDACPTAIMVLETIANFGKKIRLVAPEKVRKETLDAYERIERNIPEPTRFWFDDEFCHPLILDGGSRRLPDLRDNALWNEFIAREVSNPLHARHSTWSSREDFGVVASFQQFCDEFAGSIPEYSPASEIWWERYNGRTGVRHGPGAVAIGSRNTDKYIFPHWDDTLDRVFPKEDFLMPYEEPEDTQVPSRLCLVRKDMTKFRVIAAEPHERQWTQQLTLQFLKRKVLNRMVDGQILLSNQEASRAMSREGSLTGKLCTIDLSDASDRLSLCVVERCLRKAPTLLRALRAHRTRYLSLPDGRGTIRLAKFATQGTAVTFPIQSIIYWLVARFATEWVTSKSAGVRVYGDDIIVPTDAYALVEYLLSYLGLVVNNDKSFHRGRFRESCGGNYYAGYEVTPVRIQTALEDDPNSIVAIRDVSNNAFKAGLWHLASALRALDPWAASSPVVKRDGVLEGRGYISHVGDSVRHLKWRRNYDLQCVEHYIVTYSAKRKSRGIRDLSRLSRSLYEMPHCSEGYTSDAWETGGLERAFRWDTLQGV